MRLENETKVVTLANHNGRRQSYEPIKTRSSYMKLTQDAGKLVHASYDWLWFDFWLDEKEARVFNANRKPKQTRITLYASVKTAPFLLICWVMKVSLAFQFHICTGTVTHLLVSLLAVGFSLRVTYSTTQLVRAVWRWPSKEEGKTRTGWPIREEGVTCLFFFLVRATPVSRPISL